MTLSRHNIFALFILFLLLFIGFWRLPYSPATWYDEGLNLGVARSLITDGVFSLKIAPDEFVENRQFLITTNYPVLLPAALSLKFFGINFFAARLPMVAYLFLFAGMAYLLTRKWYGNKSALITLALITTFLPFYGNGKAALGEVPGAFFLLAGLFYLDNKKLWKLFLAGLFLGLSITTKPFFLLVLPALFIGELYLILTKKYRKLTEYAILSVGLVIPMFFWFWSINPDLTFGKISSAVSYYSNSYADETNIAKLVLSNLKRFFTETTPLHFLALALVSVIVLIRGVWKKESRMQEIILITFIILNFLWYLKTPGWYRYFFPAHLLLFLFFPMGLMKLFSKKFVIAIVVFFIAIQSFVLVSKRNNPLYFATEAQDFVEYINKNTLESDGLLIVNSPQVAFLLPDRIIFQYVRINPQLVFAPKNILENSEMINQRYIVVGSLNNEDAGVKKILDQKYEEIKNIGHYTLYRVK